jgi:hypothetical protein
MAKSKSLKIILDAWLERDLEQLGDDEVRKKVLLQCYAIIKQIYKEVEALPSDKQFEALETLRENIEENFRQLVRSKQLGVEK